jgi:trans-2,3-dihydro-3-hydroxyanthranilate isomerase
MANLDFYIVDVFAETKYAGNQLAVVLNAAALSTGEMQAIAREMNYSETTFVTASEPREGGYEVRIFTPEQELPFAGHPTLGTAFVLQQAIVQQPVECIKLNLKIGQIPVTLSYQNGLPDLLWMQQPSPTFGAILPAAAVANVLSLDGSAIVDHLPIQEVSTGVPFILVPLKTLADLQRIRVRLDRFTALVEPLQAKEIFVFCPETRHPENHFSARMFAPLLGIAEDPATGSANGCFAGYLVKHRYFGDAAIEVRVEQGYEMGRPSLLLLSANASESQIQVKVGGRVIPIASGRFV